MSWSMSGVASRELRKRPGESDEHVDSGVSIPTSHDSLAQVVCQPTPLTSRGPSAAAVASSSFWSACALCCVSMSITSIACRHASIADGSSAAAFTAFTAAAVALTGW